MNALTQSAEKRIRSIRKEMMSSKIDALFINHLPSIRYLTGFSGSSAILVIKQDDMHFVTNDLYEMQIKQEVYSLKGLITHISRNSIAEISAKKIAKYALETLEISSSEEAKHSFTKLRPKQL